MTESIKECFLCGSSHLISVPYIHLKSQSLVRNIAYAIPLPMARVLSWLNNRFAVAFRPVMTNKEYFSGNAVYCLDCHTGAHLPLFDQLLLTNYYKQFYWTNRDQMDGCHLPNNNRPNDAMLALSSDRIEWLFRFVKKVNSVIDFGAGDCAAGYALTTHGYAKQVHVVDPSARAGALALQYGMTHSLNLAAAPVVDLIYSAHSIEHVHDLCATIKGLLDRTQPGGHLFFETPNIGDENVFSTLVHTPHTFMLSENTFYKLAEIFPFKVVATEVCGPRWRDGHKNLQSDERTDLRVLLQKTGR